MRRLYTFDTGPKSMHLAIEYAHPNVLTAGSPGRIKRIAPYLQGPELIESDRGLATVHGTYKGFPITAFSTGMGPASVSITMPEVIEACDQDRMHIIRLGTSGGLQKHLGIGDLVITTDVERAESTSDKIMGIGYRAAATPEVVGVLRQVSENLKAQFQSVYCGVTRVTDDIYFDALASKAKKSQGDVLAVSMEGSAIFALRDRYNLDDGRMIKAGELLSVSDVVVAEHEKIDAKEFLARMKEIEESMIRIGLESIVELNMPGGQRPLFPESSD